MQKDNESMDAQRLEKDSGNAVGTMNQMLICATGVELKDEEFWQDLRKELTCNQWKAGPTFCD